MTSLLSNELCLIALQMALALLIDKLVGEVKRYHPLVGFGHLTNALEARFNQGNYSKAVGTGCWLLLVLPLPIFLWSIEFSQPWSFILETLLLYFAIGLRSLDLHAMQVFKPLAQHDLTIARQFTGYLVSRDTQTLTAKQMSRATVESVLENGHDAVIASLFYFVIGGAPLVILHRLVNTLDAMWGYKNSRFKAFGWCAARMDDWLGWLSAYCSAFLYVIQTKSPAKAVSIFYCSWQQSRLYKSKNGGLCMAAGASVIGCQLGGISQYQGQALHSPILGAGTEVEIAHIPKAISLVRKSAWTWVVLMFISGLIWSMLWGRI
ncbi:adenosylcobinamide-phosphate synthase CbiB [Alteromonadaceae bacterium BrNp21-10]|nr:adenosylcobinamide-phosphate synthase CbiB [Alteromonadaceae bacterium BrNp21-10]